MITKTTKKESRGMEENNKIWVKTKKTSYGKTTVDIFVIFRDDSQQSYIDSYTIENGQITSENSRPIYIEQWGGLNAFFWKFIDTSRIVDYSGIVIRHF